MGVHHGFVMQRTQQAERCMIGSLVAAATARFWLV